MEGYAFAADAVAEHRRLAEEILFKIDEAIEPGLERCGIAAKLGAEGAVALFLAQPVLRPRAHGLQPMLFPRLHQEIPEVVLHLDRVVQLPAKLPRIGHANGAHGAHAQLDILRRKPGKALVGKGGFGLGVADHLAQNVARFRPGNGKNAPLGGDILNLDIAEILRLVLGRLPQVIGVVILPGAGGDEVIFILAPAQDRVFAAGGARGGEGVGEIDAPHLWQAVGGEPFEEGGRARPLHHMLCECRGVDQPHALADGTRLGLGIFPPAAAAETAGSRIVKSGLGVVIGPLPAVDLPELRAKRLLAIVGGGGAQRAAGGALLVGVVEDIDMLIGLLVLARRIFGGDPAAETLGIEAGHVDLGLALHHQLGEIMARAARRRDAEAEALGEPHVAKPRRRADQRVAIGGVADGAVEIVLEAHRFRRRDAMDEGHVFLFDPLQIEREEIGAEAVGHAVEETRGRALLVGAEDPAAALLAHIPFRIRIAQHRVLGIARRAPFHKRRIWLGDDILMLNRDRRALDAEQPRCALGVVAGGRHHMLGADLEGFFGGHQIAALLAHHMAAHDPFAARPLVAVHLHAAQDLNPALARAPGHGHGHIGGVYVAVRRVIERAHQILGAHKRPALTDFLRREPFIGHAAGFGGGGVEHVFIHPLAALRHAQIADHREAGIEPGFRFERLVELDGVIVDMGGGVGHVEIGQKPRRVPCGAGGELVALQEDHIFPARARQMIGDRGADSAATHNKCPNMRFHCRSSPGNSCLLDAGKGRPASNALRRLRAKNDTLRAGALAALQQSGY